LPILARDRLIVALDLASLIEAERTVVRLGDSVSFYKVGYELVMAGGLPFAADLVRAGKRVFLTTSATRSHVPSNEPQSSASRFLRCMPIRRRCRRPSKGAARAR
jgi:hypothetical protein